MISPPHRSAKNVYVDLEIFAVCLVFTHFDPPRNFSRFPKIVLNYREGLAVLSPTEDLPGSMRFNPKSKKLLALQIGPDPDFRRFLSLDFEIFVEIGVFTIFRGPQHFSFRFAQRTWMGKVLAYKLALLFVWDGSILDVAPTPVFAPENARKLTFPPDFRPEVEKNFRIFRLERSFPPPT